VNEPPSLFADGSAGSVTSSPSGRLLLTAAAIPPGLDIDGEVRRLGDAVALERVAVTAGAAALIEPNDALAGSVLLLCGGVALTSVSGTEVSFVRPAPGAVARHVVTDDVESVTVELGASAPASTAADGLEPWNRATRAADRLVLTPGGRVAADAASGASSGQTRIEVIDLLPPPAGEAAPLPVEALPPPTVGNAQVLGIRCPVDHHNHPDAEYCSSCGRRMGVNATAVLVVGPRPPVGLFLTDDGTAIPIAGDLLLGREPDTHDDVAHGRRQGVVLPDETAVVSRHHLAVSLDGWNVVVTDLASANGTVLWSARTGLEYRLDPDEGVVLESGDRVDLGSVALRLSLHHVN